MPPPRGAERTLAAQINVIADAPEIRHGGRIAPEGGGEGRLATSLSAERGIMHGAVRLYKHPLIDLNEKVLDRFFARLAPQHLQCGPVIEAMLAAA